MRVKGVVPDFVILKISSALRFEVNDFPEHAEKTLTQYIQGVHTAGPAKCTSVKSLVS